MVIRQLRVVGFGEGLSCSLKFRNTSPIIGVIRARAYTSIREMLLQVLRYMFVILSSAFLLSSRSLVLCSVALRVMDLLSLWTL